MAGAHGLSRLRGLRGRSLGDFSDNMAALTPLIQSAAQVATVAEMPTPSTSIQLPSGAIVTASGGAMLPASLTSSLSTSSFLPFLLIGGLALVAYLAMRK